LASPWIIHFVIDVVITASITMWSANHRRPATTRSWNRLASSQRTATRREPASTTAFGRREAKKLGFRARAGRANKYSSKVQQCPRHSVRSNGVRTHSSRLNEAQRGVCRDFASKGLGVRVPLAPQSLPICDSTRTLMVSALQQDSLPPALIQQARQILAEVVLVH
jgi:hypothetical protein